jgi:ABC-2 type transport system ATP-binding protein
VISDRSAAEETVIEISGLRHRYGEREALRGVSLTIERGEIFALLGPNGGGKTTLFKILSTLMRAGEGSVRVLGHHLRSEAERVRPRIGVVFQNPGLDPKLTVTENLVHHGHLYGLGGTSLRARVREVLADLDLTDRAADLVETLSGGLARRTDLARGLLHAPELLLLDEPTASLDPSAAQIIRTHIRDLARHGGCGILWTSHNMYEVEEVCDRVMFLSRGRLLLEGDPKRLPSEHGTRNLEELFIRLAREPLTHGEGAIP